MAMEPTASPVPALTVPPRGRTLLGVWAAVPGALLAPFVFWRGMGAGLLFCLLWAGLTAAVWVRACSFVAVCNGATLTVYVGIAFPVRRAVLCRAVTGVHLVRTPLAQLAGVSLLAVETAGARLVLPAVPAQQAAQAAAWLTEGRA